MEKRFHYISVLPLQVVVLFVFFIVSVGGNRAITVLTETAPLEGRKCVIIDAGHGGIDGGATSCTGALESAINLEISLRLDDLLHLLGIDTYMIRKSDISVYTTGESIAAKKVSDLKQRVKIANEIQDPILISIHQNHFTDNRYSGAQIFYAATEGSAALANKLQAAFIDTLNPMSKRKAKKADGIYLMQNIKCTGVLVECGFLSNPKEEVLLCSDAYQKKVCCVIASTLSLYLHCDSVS